MEQKQQIDVEELRRGGVVQLRGKDMFSLWVKTSCCNLNSKQLNKIADIADKYGRGFLLFTTRQIPIIPFIDLKDIEKAKRELEEVHLELDRCGPRVRNVNVCYDDKICPDAVTNSISLGEKLDRFFYSDILHKIKLGISGCKKDCIISRVLSDIGFIGIGEGSYEVYVGGRLGLNPMVGIKMNNSPLSEEGCVRFVQNYFDLLKAQGKEGERSADLINRLGADKVKEELNKNLKEGFSQPIKCETALKEKEEGKEILRIRATCGEVTSTQVRKIADIAQRYGKGFVHFVVRGSPEIPGVDRTNLQGIGEELDGVGLEPLNKGVDNLQTCFGDYCTNSIVDTRSLLRKIEEKVSRLGLNNLDIKISAAGCPNSCGIAHLNDIGFLGVVEPEVDITRCKKGCKLCPRVCKRKAIEIKDDVAVIDKEKCGYCGECIRSCPFDAIYEKREGYAVLVGGKGGEDTRLGEVIAEFLSEEEALYMAERYLKEQIG